MAKNRDNLVTSSATNNSASNLSDMQRATLKQLRKMNKLTQTELSDTMGVGQDTISRLEKRHDMLLSTISNYIESLGGKIELVATFPDQSPIAIDCLKADNVSNKKKPPAEDNRKKEQELK
jgi:DNA-binding XRE family transcriptional regulator